jgi:RNA polymerase sigma factor (sigma-70 family)
MSPLTQTETDTALVQKAVNGCTDSFNELVERYFGCAYTVAYSRVSVRETAEDIAQEAFLRAYLHLDTLKEPSRFAAWICRIIRNIASDWRDKAVNRSELLPRIPVEEIEDLVPCPSADARDRAAAGEEFEALTRAIDALPAELREVVLLHFGDGIARSRIAELLELHPSTVGRRLEQAVKQLRAGLEPVLQRGAAPLRTNRRAAARSIGIITAVAGMSAAGKASLAAATAAGVALPGIAVAGASGIGISLGAVGKVAVAIGAIAVLLGSAAFVREQWRAREDPAVAASEPRVKENRRSRPAMPPAPRAEAPARALASPTPAETDPRKIAELVAAQNKALIRNEIVSLGTHPWAGTYHATDQYSAECYLHVAPATGFVFESHLKGEAQVVHGRVVQQEGMLTVGHDGDSSEGRLLRRDRTLIPVKWGGRTYLVAPLKMGLFGSQVNIGSEPRTETFGSRFLLREGDEATSVTGWPDLPEKYRHFLLEDAVYAAVTSVEDVTTWVGEGGPGYYIQTKLTMAGGTDIGLDTNLKLFSLDPRGQRQMVTISDATETTSRATHICHSTKPFVPHVDWVVTSGKFDQ